MEREAQFVAHATPAAYAQPVTYGVPGQQMYYPPMPPGALYPMAHGVAPFAFPGTGMVPTEPPPEDESCRSKVFEVHGNSTNFNINSLLYNNILQSDYFKALYQLRTYHETIGE